MASRGLSIIDRFPGQPSLRAAVGGLLVTLALLGVSQAYAAADGPPRHRVVVAAGTVAPGEALAPDQLAVLPAELPDATAQRAFTDPAVLDGARSLVPLAAGDLVLVGHVLPAGGPPPGGAEVALAISADRALGGRVQVGEEVDLVATAAGGPARVVAHRAQVTAVTDADDPLLGATGAVLLTLRVAADVELLAVVAAQEEGRLTLVRPGATARVVDR